MNKLTNPKILLTFLLCWVVAFITIEIPQNNWDLAGHLGSALTYSDLSNNEIHQQTYQLLKDTLPEEAYNAVIKGNAEREVWSTDADAFVQTFPFYKPRVLLTIPTYIAYKFGLNPITFIQAYTSIAAALGLMLFFLPVMRTLSLAEYFLTAPVLALLTGILEVARFEGSDALVFFLFGCFYYLLHNRQLACLIPLALLPLARSDMILLTLFMSVPCSILFYRKWHFVLIASLLAAILYIGVNYHAQNYGWAKQFYVVHVEYLFRPADETVSITPEMYINAFVQGAIQLIYNKTFLLFLFFSISIFLYALKTYEFSQLVNSLKRADRNSNEQICIVIAIFSALFVAAHFVVFPTAHTRYFAGQYLIVGLCFLSIFWSNAKLRASNTQ